MGGELDGWDVGEAFRSARPHVAVIYASGGTIVPPREVPDSRFFAKPYRGWEVVDACRELSGGGHPAKAVRG